MSKNGPAPDNKPERVDITKPGLWTIKISPELAFDWLTKNFDANRRMRPNWIEYLAAEMLAGRWMSDHPDAILFSKEGKIIQGQHRLSAVVESGKTVEMRVETGVDEGLYPYLDSGLSRSLEDRVKFTANWQENKVIVMLINFFRKRDRGKTRKGGNRTSPEVAHEIFNEHSKALLWAAKAHKLIRGVGRTPVLAAATEYHERDPMKADEFARTLYSTNGEGPVSQARLLRDTLLRRTNGRGVMVGGEGLETYQLAVAAMKAHLEGRFVKRLVQAEWGD